MKNKHKVPKKQWSRWSPLARRVFNEVFEGMREQGLFLHPKAARAALAHWRTTRWNAAWVAADAVDGFRTTELPAA